MMSEYRGFVDYDDFLIGCSVSASDRDWNTYAEFQ